MLEAFKNLLTADNPRPIRRREWRFLLVAIGIGGALALVFGLLLYVLNAQGRL